MSKTNFKTLVFSSCIYCNFQVLAQKETQTLNPFEHLYSKVDREAILRAVEASQDEDHIGPNEPSYYDNASYDDRQDYRGSGTFEDSEIPPPIPTSTIHEDEDEDEQRLGDEDPGYATIRSTMSNNHDEGYSTVDETLQRAGNKVRTTERYVSGVNNAYVDIHTSGVGCPFL